MSSLQECTILFALVGTIFGASLSFQKLTTINWYKGPYPIRTLRMFLANCFLAPSWLFFIYQEKIIRYFFPLGVGFGNFVVNSLHFFLLYYFLFGMLPTFIFKELKILNNELKFSRLISH